MPSAAAQLLPFLPKSSAHPQIHHQIEHFTGVDSSPNRVLIHRFTPKSSTARAWIHGGALSESVLALPQAELLSSSPKESRQGLTSGAGTLHCKQSTRACCTDANLCGSCCTDSNLCGSCCTNANLSSLLTCNPPIQPPPSTNLSIETSPAH